VDLAAGDVADVDWENYVLYVVHVCLFIFDVRIMCIYIYNNNKEKNHEVEGCRARRAFGRCAALGLKAELY
jgi:hypothetical protein